MLLKGHEEVRASPRPLAAADMVLVRLAYASDLPPPSELASRLRVGAAASEQAPRELGQELMRKLKAWTGRVWIVALSDEEGAQPLGQQRREKEAREIEKVREHPAVKQVMQHFPGARIAAVRPVAEPVPPADGADEPEEFKEDGTN